MSSPPRRTYRKYGGFQILYYTSGGFFFLLMDEFLMRPIRAAPTERKSTCPKVCVNSYGTTILLHSVRSVYNNIWPYRNGLRNEKLFIFLHFLSPATSFKRRHCVHTCMQLRTRGVPGARVLHRTSSLSCDGKITRFDDDGYSRNACIVFTRPFKSHTNININNNNNRSYN